MSISTGTVELRDEFDGSVTVYVNGVPSSTLREDFVLDFEYMMYEAAVIAAWDEIRADGAWLALHIGAAACTLPRYLAHMHPQSRHIAVDVDTELAELARRWWDLPRAPRLRVRAQDGLAALKERGEQSLDLVVRDAFVGDSVPSHLASEEWWTEARRVLRPGGLVVANVDNVPASRAATLDAIAAREAFGNVLVVGENAVLKRKRRGNIVLVAHATTASGLLNPLRRFAASAPLPTGVSDNWA